MSKEENKSAFLHLHSYYSEGVFGNLEIHGKNHSVYWTRLKRTADVGNKEIQVEDMVDWKEGDLIVIAPTSYKPHETEVVQIGKCHIRCLSK